jgi:lipoprotein-anchoring transpeptidase ErfK/SrfK
MIAFMRRFGGLPVVLVLVLSGCGGHSATPAATPSGTTTTSAPVEVSAEVFLLQGEGLKAVRRRLPERTAAAAVTALLQGPTAAEEKAEIHTQVPAATRLRSVSVTGGIATVDLSRAYVDGTDTPSLRARLVQLVWTATAVPGVTGVRLHVEGRKATSMGQGISVTRTLTRENVDPPVAAFLPPISVVPDTTGPGSAGGETTTWIQQRLAALGYLPSSAVTGHLGPWTRGAVLAFQGWEKLDRDAVPGPTTIARLRNAKRPNAQAGSGKRIEVHLGAQVALLVDGSHVDRVIKVSSGAPGFETPTGSFTIYRKHLKDWSYPYKVWLPYASYFTGGIAFHESPDVPAHPASHGCVRIPRDDAPAVYAFAALDTPVAVLN